MKITSNKIRKDLKSLWPNLNDIWLTDRKFCLPMPGEVKTSFDDAIRGLLPGRMESIYECEEKALFIHDKIQRVRVSCAMFGMMPEADRLSWPVGQVMGTAFKDMMVMGSHSTNIAITQDGIYLMDAETRQFWKADNKEDQPYFVYIV